MQRSTTRRAAQGGDDTSPQMRWSGHVGESSAVYEALAWEVWDKLQR